MGARQGCHSRTVVGPRDGCQGGKAQDSTHADTASMHVEVQGWRVVHPSQLTKVRICSPPCLSTREHAMVS